MARTRTRRLPAPPHPFTPGTRWLTGPSRDHELRILRIPQPGRGGAAELVAYEFRGPCGVWDGAVRTVELGALRAMLGRGELVRAPEPVGEWAPWLDVLGPAGGN